MIPLPALREMVDSYPFPLVFATVSGAHLYGFPSPDSDWDLRGCHILPLEAVMGLQAPQETLERSGLDKGLDMDLVTHDVGKFFRLLLKKNGYVLEQLLSPLVVHTTPYHQELISLSPGCITRYHAHDYLGFAETQTKLFWKENPPKVKPLLYLYRVLLTGIHLMKTGRIESNLEILNEEARLPLVPDLLIWKREGAEKQQREIPHLDAHQRAIDQLKQDLHQAFLDSHLPESPSVSAALHELLVRIRLGRP